MIRRILDVAMTDEAASRFVSLVDDPDGGQIVPAPHWKLSKTHKAEKR
jgi:hypothetical protein